MTPSQLEHIARAMDQCVNDLQYHYGVIVNAIKREREHPNPDPAQRFMKALGGSPAESLRFGLKRKINWLLDEEGEPSRRERLYDTSNAKYLQLMQDVVEDYTTKEAALEDKKYCPLCKKHVKNIKSHEKSASHKGRVRIAELEAGGWRKVQSNSNTFRVLSELLEINDHPQVVEQQHGFQSPNPKELRAERERFYGDLIVRHPHSYNKAGGASRWNSGMWTKEHVVEHEDALAKGIKWRTFYYGRDDAERAESMRQKAAWRKVIDGVIFNEDAVKTYATFSALGG
jgi:hypothetical protein